MVGNQLHINRNIALSDKNVIQDVINKEGRKVSREEIIACINYEYWKQWRKMLINSEYPIIKCNKLGYFELDFMKGKKLIWDTLKKIRWNQKQFPEKLPNDGTMMGQIQAANIKILKIVWQQINKLRHRKIIKTKKMNEDFRRKGTPERIKWNYE